MHSIHLARKQNLGLKSCDGNQELLNFLRSDLIEVATRLQKGGLGYIGEAEFEAKVKSCQHYLGGGGTGRKWVQKCSTQAGAS